MMRSDGRFGGLSAFTLVADAPDADQIAATGYLPDSTQLDALIRSDRAREQPMLNARNLTDRRVVAQCDGIMRCFYAERRSIIATHGDRC